MAERIKVLNINYVSSEYGGVPVFLMNVFRHIDHERIQYDFLTPDTTAYNPWREEIERSGGNIFEFHIDSGSWKGKRNFGRRLRTFLEEYPYDIVHINSGAVSFDWITASAAKKQGTKVIVHSHNTGDRSRWKAPFIFFMKRRMQKQADVLCACSVEAAKNLFTSSVVDRQEVIIINNGIDLQKFQYNLVVRDKMRNELNIADRFVIGHIGRFAEQKNHAFLVDIFAEILRKEPEVVLLLIGEGELEPLIREKVHNLNLDENVLFLGQRNDVADLYQVMDVFVFPSLFEGLGIVLVEAQMSGLPCYITDSIPRKVDATNLISRISLQSSAKEWAMKIINCEFDINKRCSHEQELEGAGFGIRSTVKQITKIYNDLIQQ